MSSRPLLDTDADEQLFVDREETLSQLLRAVRSGFNAALVGTRGSGKTSCLRQLALRLRREQEDLKVVFIDGTLPEDVVELLEFVRSTIGGTRYKSMFPVDPQLFVSRPVRGNPERLLRATEELREAVGNERFVVLLDGTPTPRDGHVLFGRLRDELWGIGVSWVVSVDSEHRSTVLNPPADAFFEWTVKLGNLSDDDAGEVIRKRVGNQLTPLEIVKAVSLAEGNPRRLISTAREMLSDEHSDEQTQRRKDLKTALEELGRPAMMLVAELEVVGPASASDEQLQRQLGWTRARLAQVFRELEQQGIVTASSRSEGGPGRPKKVYELVDRILST